MKHVSMRARVERSESGTYAAGDECARDDCALGRDDAVHRREHAVQAAEGLFHHGFLYPQVSCQYIRSQAGEIFDERTKYGTFSSSSYRGGLPRSGHASLSASTSFLCPRASPSTLVTPNVSVLLAVSVPANARRCASAHSSRKVRGWNLEGAVVAEPGFGLGLDESGTVEACGRSRSAW